MGTSGVGFPSLLHARESELPVRLSPNTYTVPSSTSTKTPFTSFGFGTLLSQNTYDFDFLEKEKHLKPADDRPFWRYEHLSILNFYRISRNTNDPFDKMFLNNTWIFVPLSNKMSKREDQCKQFLVFLLLWNRRKKHNNVSSFRLMKTIRKFINENKISTEKNWVP